MSAAAYLLPPISGLIVYLRGRDAAARFHGLQSVALGVLWPAGMWLGSFVAPLATLVLFVTGLVAWLAMLIGALFRRDVALPLLGHVLRRAAETSPRAAP
ncbi:MAG TPA: hypothetical protein VM573_02780 [Actinomycetota bacterium]|jgi:uncharacterized membrane protein|nr:hypothetical protein [Actinomycetota bacterium]